MDDLASPASHLALGQRGLGGEGGGGSERIWKSGRVYGPGKCKRRIITIIITLITTNILNFPSQVEEKKESILCEKNKLVY